MYVHTYAHVHMCIHTHTYVLQTYTYIHTHIRMHVFVHSTLQNKVNRHLCKVLMRRNIAFLTSVLSTKPTRMRCCDALKAVLLLLQLTMDLVIEVTDSWSFIWLHIIVQMPSYFCHVLRKTSYSKLEYESCDSVTNTDSFESKSSKLCKHPHEGRAFEILNYSELPMSFVCMYLRVGLCII